MPESTKDRIIAAAIDLFAKKGYAETTIRDIAENVGIKTSSIYYYFESKEAILHFILDDYKKVVDANEHHHMWEEEKKSILKGETDISVDKIMDFMFFKFDGPHNDQYRKVVRILCSEIVRNETIQKFERQNIDRSFEYIKSILDTLLEAKKIPDCNTAKLAGVLYAITFAFMHLDSVDIRHIGKDYEDTGMFSLLEYVLRMIIEGLYE